MIAGDWRFIAVAWTKKKPSTGLADTVNLTQDQGIAIKLALDLRESNLIHGTGPIAQMDRARVS